MTRSEREQLGELLSAYLDGELSAAERKLAEQRIERDAEARALLDELRRTSHLVASLPRHSAPRTLADELRLQLERMELLGPTAESTAPFVRVRRRRPWVALAAMLALVTLAGWWGLRSLELPHRDGGTRVADSFVPTNELEEARRTLRESERSGPDGLSERGRLDAASREADRSGSDVLANGRDIRVGRSAPSAPSAASLRRVTPPGRSDGDRLTGADPFKYPAASQDQAPIEAKLAQGASLEALREHPYASEAVRLRVAVGTDDARKAMVDRVAKTLSARRVVDLDDTRHLPEGAEPFARGFYQRGQQGRNFAPEDATGVQEQILLHVPVRMVEEVVAEVEQSAAPRSQIELAAGDFVFQGQGNVREVVRLLNRPGADEGRSTMVRAEEPAATTTVGGNSADGDLPADFAKLAEAGARQFDELLIALGIPARTAPPQGASGGPPRAPAEPADDHAETDRSAGERVAAADRESLVDRRARAGGVDSERSPAGSFRAEDVHGRRDATGDESVAKVATESPTADTAASTSGTSGEAGLASTGPAAFPAADAGRFVTLVVEFLVDRTLVPQPTPAGPPAAPSPTTEPSPSPGGRTPVTLPPNK